MANRPGFLLQEVMEMITGTVKTCEAPVESQPAADRNSVFTDWMSEY